MTTSIKEMREQAAEIVTEARKLFDSIDKNTPDAEATEIEKRFDAMMSEHGKLEQKIERAQQLKSAEDRLKVDPRKPTGDDIVGDEESDQPEQRKLEYREVWLKQLRYGVGELDKEERSVLKNGLVRVKGDDIAQNSGQELRALTSTTGSSGGYTVPEGFSGDIDKQLALWGPMWDASIVREWNTSSGNPVPWPTINDTANTGAIKAENAAVTDDGGVDPTFGEKVFNAYIYDTEMVRVPLELLQDSFFNIEELIEELFGERLGRTANTALTTGTGSSQPDGIVTASSAGKTAASPTAVTSDEILDLYHSVDPAYRQSPKCRWQFNDSTLLAIKKLKDGDGNYLWQMGDVRSGEPDTLWSKPYSINQAMPSIATGTKPIIFGDHGRYVVRKVLGFQVMTLRERYAEFFQVGMVGFKRFDGKLLNSAAVKHMLMA